VPIDLGQLLTPEHCAVLTMELQEDVVGTRSSFPELSAAMRAGGALDNAGRLLDAARQVGAGVVHCTAGFRSDRRGSATNSPLIAAMLRRPEHMVLGTPGVDLVPELRAAPGDLVSDRHNGVSPFTGTDLDGTLRSLGVSTVVATGVSLNLALPGLAIEAVNLGYHVVIASDAVAGVPADYGEAVLRHTLSLVATISTVDAIINTWMGSQRTPA
jgi:nicotinamidase-related amidase